MRRKVIRGRLPTSPALSYIIQYQRQSENHQSRETPPDGELGQFRGDIIVVENEHLETSAAAIRSI